MFYYNHIVIIYYHFIKNKFYNIKVNLYRNSQIIYILYILYRNLKIYLLFYLNLRKRRRIIISNFTCKRIKSTDK